MSIFPKEQSFISGISKRTTLETDIKWDWSAKLVSSVMKRAVKHYLRFTDDDVSSLPQASGEKEYLLYLHVPFCVTLCPYCSFHRFKMHEPTARRYFELLREEMRMTAKLGYNFNSAYFGGGTTSILPDELAKTIDLAKELFDIKEVSSETDPNHIDDYSLEYTKDRIDRLSVGIQSFCDRHLESIGRQKKFGTADEQYEKVSKIIEHFPIVNIDLIYNFPTQTCGELAADIEKVKKLSPQQVTFYPLMYAPYAGEELKRKLGKSDSKSEAEFYRLISSSMSEPYIRRSSWTYALWQEDFIDEYVVDHSEYVGLGSGAFSFLDGKLYANSFSLKEYARMIESGSSSAVKSVRFGKYSVSQYRMMVEMFGLTAYPSHRPFAEYSALRMMGAVKGSGKDAVMTEKGLFLLSVMMKCFYNGMDYIRETMRKDLTSDDEIILP